MFKRIIWAVVWSTLTLLLVGGGVVIAQEEGITLEGLRQSLSSLYARVDQMDERLSALEESALVVPLSETEMSDGICPVWEYSHEFQLEKEVQLAYFEKYDRFPDDPVLRGLVYDGTKNLVGLLFYIWERTGVKGDLGNRYVFQLYSGCEYVGFTPWETANPLGD